MKTRSHPFCAAALALVAPVAAAQVDRDDHAGPFRAGWYAAPMATWFMADSQRCGVDDGVGAAVALGHRGDFASLELWGQFLSASYDCTYTRTNEDGDEESVHESGDAKLNGGGLALVTGPFFEGRILSRLFGVVGFGVIRRQDHPQFDQDDSTIFGDAGLGYMQPLMLFGRDLNLRAEARYRYDVQQPPRPEGTPAQYQDIVVNLGLQIPLSPQPQPVPEPEPEPVTVTAPVDTDSDNDGVREAVDQCPGTPAGAAVDAAGCPADAGAGAVVAQQAGETVVLAGVTFELNSDQLTADAMVVLDAIAQDLNSKPQQRSEVGGHTDATGDETYNLDLSQRRAESVRRYLIEQGVNPDHLTAVGYGETQPIADNETREGRARNRRVELKVLE